MRITEHLATISKDNAGPFLTVAMLRRPRILINLISLALDPEIESMGAPYSILIFRRRST